MGINKQKNSKDRLLPVILSEINFLTFPLFNLARKGLKNITSIKFSKSVQRGSEKVDIFWKVLSHPEYGFPGPFDKEVHKAVEALITQRGFPLANPVPFSLYELCKLMNINASGKNIKAIKDALLRIATTSVYSKQTFYSKSKKEWIEELFHLYDYVTFKGKYRPDTHEEADTNYLFLGKWYLDNLNAFYLKSLDYNFYKNLENPIEKRYYEIMSVKFYGAFKANIPFLRYRYSSLCDLFPLTRQPYLSLAKQQLDSAHKRLIKEGFFKKVSWQETPEKNDWLIYFYPGPRAQELLNPQRLLKYTKNETLKEINPEEEQIEFSFPSDPESGDKNSGTSFIIYSKNNNNKDINNTRDSHHRVPSQGENFVVAFPHTKLEEYKISPALINEFLKKYSAEYLIQKIEIIEFKRSQGEKIKNPGGMLRKAIEEDWQPPEEFTTEAQRQARAEEKRKAEKKKQKQSQKERKIREQAKKIAEAVYIWRTQAPEDLQQMIHARATREVEEEYPEISKTFLGPLIQIRENNIIAKEYLKLETEAEA